MPVIRKGPNSEYCSSYLCVQKATKFWLVDNSYIEGKCDKHRDKFAERKFSKKMKPIKLDQALNMLEVNSVISS